MGVVLVDRVIGVDNGDGQSLGDPTGHQEGGKLTLRVDDVRLPIQNPLHKTTGEGRLNSGAGIDFPRAHRTDIGYPIRFIGVEGLRQGQDTNLMSAPDKLSPQIQYRGHNPIHGRGIPICCNQDFHKAQLLPYRQLPAPVPKPS